MASQDFHVQATLLVAELVANVQIRNLLFLFVVLFWRCCWLFLCEGVFGGFFFFLGGG